MPVQAANRWIAGGATNLWTDVGNWSDGVAPPNATSHPATGWDDPSGPFYPLTPDPSDDFPLYVNEAQLTEEGTTTLIDATVTAATYSLYVGFNGASNELVMTGGTLEVGDWHLNVGRGYNQSGNPNPVATMHMSGGTINTGLIKVPEQFVDSSQADPYDSAPLHGEFFMSGGEINARKINVGQFTGSGEAWFSGDAVVNLTPNVPGDPSNGGYLEMKQDWYIDGLPVPTTADAYIDISGKAVINIYGHKDQFTVSPDQSELDRYQGYVDVHELTAYGGTAAPIITLHTDGDAPMITIEAPEVPGDANGDGVVDLLDLDILGTNFGQTPADYGDGDFNDDDVVDLLDLDILGSNFGLTAADISPLPPLAGAAVPEPAACGLLLGFAALTCLTGRRTNQPDGRGSSPDS